MQFWKAPPAGGCSATRASHIPQPGQRHWMGYTHPLQVSRRGQVPKMERPRDIPGAPHLNGAREEV